MRKATAQHLWAIRGERKEGEKQQAQETRAASEPAQELRGNQHRHVRHLFLPHAPSPGFSRFL